MERQDDKICSRRNARIGQGCIGVGEVLPERSFAKTSMLMLEAHVLVGNWDIRKVNLLNLKSAISSALLLLPPEFSEEDLYVKICSLSYMGDLRMLFAEDKHKDCGLSASNSLFCSLPSTIVRRVKPNLGLKHESIETGTATHQILISSREEAANCIRNALRQKVMIASARQAAAVVSLMLAGILLEKCQRLGDPEHNEVESMVWLLESING